MILSFILSQSLVSAVVPEINGDCKSTANQFGPACMSAFFPSEEGLKGKMVKYFKCDKNENEKIDPDEVQCVLDKLIPALPAKSNPSKGWSREDILKWLVPFLENKDVDYYPGWGPRILDGIKVPKKKGMLELYDCDKNGHISDEELRKLVEGNVCAPPKDSKVR